MVAIEYTGPRVPRSEVGESDEPPPGGGRYLALCNTDWVCAAGWHSRKPETRFEKLPVLGVNCSSGNGSSAIAPFQSRSRS